MCAALSLVLAGGLHNPVQDDRSDFTQSRCEQVHCRVLSQTHIPGSRLTCTPRKIQKHPETSRSSPICAASSLVANMSTVVSFSRPKTCSPPRPCRLARPWTCLCRPGTLREATSLVRESFLRALPPRPTQGTHLVQGYLAYKETPTPIETPEGPRHRPTVES